MSQYKVVEILNDDYKLVLNAGTNKGIKTGNRFLIYALSEHEIIDPDTSESLGYLEIVKGTGKVVHVQDKMCTIESDAYEISPPTKIIRKQNLLLGAYGGTTEEHTSSKEQIPFESPEIGDFAKRI